MYADRFERRSTIKPGSLAVAIGINGGIIAALLFSAPVLRIIERDQPLLTENIPIDPPPEPIQPEIKREVRERATAKPERPDVSTATVSSSTSDFVLPPLPPFPPQPPLPAGETVVIDPPVAPPVLTGATVDPRYARDLQPEYPSGERRAERAGNVTVRVTIGRDGRVSAAECIAAASDAFCRATRTQALSKWRFKPATRDGVAVESTKEMTVRFELAV